MGRRRPWILFAQSGMVITLGALLFVSNLAESIQLVTLMLFIHNLFSSLQDVGVDALAVDVLQPDEVAKRTDSCLPLRGLDISWVERFWG